MIRILVPRFSVLLYSISAHPTHIIVTMDASAPVEYSEKQREVAPTEAPPAYADVSQPPVRPQVQPVYPQQQPYQPTNMPYPQQPPIGYDPMTQAGYNQPHFSTQNTVVVTQPQHTIIHTQVMPNASGAIFFSCFVAWCCCLCLGVPAFVLAGELQKNQLYIMVLLYFTWPRHAPIFCIISSQCAGLKYSIDKL